MYHSVKHTPALLSAGTSAALFTILLTSSVEGLADEYDQFANAKNAFDAGEYEEAVNRFEEMLSSNVQNPALVLEGYKLLGISYLFVDNEIEAEKIFTKLLTKAPDFSLDPLLYPIEVIDFFVAIKQKNKKRLSALARAKAIEAEKRKREERQRRKEEIARLTRNVYVEKTTKERSLLVALMPFGAGQFQNGQRVKGVLFLTSELLFGAAAVTSYFLHSALRSKAENPIEDADERAGYENRERAFRLTNHISLGLVSGMAVWGITDSLYHFKKTSVFWKNVDEDKVPESLRPRIKPAKAFSLTLYGNKDEFITGISGRF